MLHARPAAATNRCTGGGGGGGGRSGGGRPPLHHHLRARNVAKWGKETAQRKASHWKRSRPCVLI